MAEVVRKSGDVVRLDFIEPEQREWWVRTQHRIRPARGVLGGERIRDGAQAESENGVAADIRPLMHLGCHHIVALQQIGGRKDEGAFERGLADGGHTVNH